MPAPPTPVLPHRHPTSPLGGGVTGRSASQRAAAATTRRCLPPTTTTSPPLSICAQVAANTASDTCHLSTRFPEVRPLRETLFSPSQGTSSILVPSPNVYLCPVCEFHGLKAKKTRGKQTEGWGVGALRSLVFVIWII